MERHVLAALVALGRRKVEASEEAPAAALARPVVAAVPVRQEEWVTELEVSGHLAEEEPLEALVAQVGLPVAAVEHLLEVVRTVATRRPVRGVSARSSLLS